MTSAAVGTNSVASAVTPCGGRKRDERDQRDLAAPGATTSKRIHSPTNKTNDIARIT